MIRLFKMRFVIITNLLFCIEYLLLSQKVKCSLLSRLKNRYEYIPQDSTQDIPKEDLYDFEYSTIASEYQRDSSEIVTKNNPYDFDNEEYSAVSIKINDTALDKEYDHTTNLEYSFYTINAPKYSRVSNMTVKYKVKTWPSYFPPKIEHRTFLGTTIFTTLEKEMYRKNTKSIKENSNHRSLMKTKIYNNTSLKKFVGLKRKWLTNNNFFPKESKQKLPYNRTKALTSVFATISICYKCGMSVTGIQTPVCYAAFNGHSEHMDQPLSQFEVQCEYSSANRVDKNKFFGPHYIGGCYKRFLDVGMVYDERGCRTKEPDVGRSYASKRLASMEKLLGDVEEGCVFSPLASLTPFSRAISLYARYHVCVCNSALCNRGVNFFSIDSLYITALSAINI